MAIKADELLALAKELQKGPKEAHLRAAVSHAFYFSFHSVKALFEKIRSGPELAGGTHTPLIEELKNFKGEFGDDFDNKVRVLGFILDDLRLMRIDADYHLENSFTEKKPEDALLTAKRIKKAISEINEFLQQQSA